MLGLSVADRAPQHLWKVKTTKAHPLRALKEKAPRKAETILSARQLGRESFLEWPVAYQSASITCRRIFAYASSISSIENDAIRAKISFARLRKARSHSRSVISEETSIVSSRCA